MRYKSPETEEAREIAFPLSKEGLRKSGSTDFRFAASVAAFGMLLRESEYKGSANWSSVRAWASEAIGQERADLRRDFLDLVKQAEALSGKRD